MKRQDYISWDEYFMGVAKLAGMRSKDQHTQVGSCIVSKAHKILSMGYNGLPWDARMKIFHGKEMGICSLPNMHMLRIAR